MSNANYYATLIKPSIHLHSLKTKIAKNTFPLSHTEHSPETEHKNLDRQNRANSLQLRIQNKRSRGYAI